VYVDKHVEGKVENMKEEKGKNEAGDMFTNNGSIVSKK